MWPMNESLLQVVSVLLLTGCWSSTLAGRDAYLYLQVDNSTEQGQKINFFADSVQCVIFHSLDLTPNVAHYIENDLLHHGCFYKRHLFNIVVRNESTNIAIYQVEMDPFYPIAGTVVYTDSNFFHDFQLGSSTYWTKQNRIIISAAAKSTVIAWMGQIYDGIKNKPLSGIVFPGTHDSATSDLGTVQSPDLKSFIPATYVRKYGVAQSYDVKEQLVRGIRYLDIRLCEDNGIIKACHGTYSKFQHMEKIFTDVQKFLMETGNDHELVILDIQHIFPNSHLTQSQITEAVLSILGDIVADANNFSPVSQYRTFIERNKRVVVVVENGSTSDSLQSPFWNRDKNLCTFWPNSENNSFIWQTFKENIGNRSGSDCSNKLFQSQLVVTIKESTIEILIHLKQYMERTLQDFVMPFYTEYWPLLYSARSQSWFRGANIIIENFSSGFNLALFAKEVNSKMEEKCDTSSSGGCAGEISR